MKLTKELTSQAVKSADAVIDRDDYTRRDEYEAAWDGFHDGYIAGYTDCQKEFFTEEEKSYLVRLLQKDLESNDRILDMVEVYASEDSIEVTLEEEETTACLNGWVADELIIKKLIEKLNN